MKEIVSYTDKSISEIEKTDILSEDDLEKLVSIKEALKETWVKQHVFRTETEMRYAVLNDTMFPTKAHKYLQARREQEVHFGELVRLSCNYQEKQGELLESQGNLEELQNETNEQIREGKIIQAKARIRRSQFELAGMRKVAHHRTREVSVWEKIKKELDDGSFDIDDIDGIQFEAYSLRWQRELQSEMTSQQANGNRIAILRGQLSGLQKRE